MLKPIQHLDSCNFNSYSLQLSLYAYMLEKRYGYKIAGLYLIHLREDEFREYECPYMKKEMELLTQLRLQEIRRK